MTISKEFFTFSEVMIGNQPEPNPTPCLNYGWIRGEKEGIQGNLL